MIERLIILFIGFCLGFIINSVLVASKQADIHSNNHIERKEDNKND